MNDLSDLIASRAPRAALRAHLDELLHEDRLQQVRALAPPAVRALYEHVQGQPAALAHFVPECVGQGCPVRHLGVNSLPFFRRFEKRFMRAADGSPQLWGYNHQAMQRWTGPGYFVVASPAAGEETAIDYHHVPSSAPGAGWPAVRENRGLLAGAVYGQMIDRMRCVSEHVSVGRAFKRGKAMGAYFALVREVAPPAREPEEGCE